MVKQNRRFTMLPKQHQAELREAVLLLRYRCARHTPGARKYATYSTIAQGLQMPYNQVQHICRKAMQGEKPVT